MPDVDWERVAEALFTAERLESNYERGLDDRMVVEPEVLAAARWGLEAQQRGRLVWWCETHGATGTRQGCFRWLAIDSKVFDCVMRRLTLGAVVLFVLAGTVLARYANHASPAGHLVAPLVVALVVAAVVAVTGSGWMTGRPMRRVGRATSSGTATSTGGSCSWKPQSTI